MPTPYILQKCAMSLDGYIDDSSPERLILSNQEDFEVLDVERANSDAILVGAGTLRKDNPRLLIRSEELRKARVQRGLPADIMKVTLTTSGNLSRDLQFFTTGECEKVVYCVDNLFEQLSNSLADVATIVSAGKHAADPHFILQDLGDRGIKRLLLEGGSSLGTLFLTEDLVDELQLSIAPFFVGQPEAAHFVNKGTFPQDKLHRMHLERVSKVGDMALLTYFPKRRSTLVKSDFDWLSEAIELSRKCTPSEEAFSVGAVIVDAAGNKLTSGFSRETGEKAHAEEVAIQKAQLANLDLQGATIYSSLEPCSVRLSGRMPCVEHILSAGIQRVVYAMAEPAVFVRGEGAAELERRGVTILQIRDLENLVESLNSHLMNNKLK